MININRAKQKILDLAIKGKLTKQLKSDGNAADLLFEIQKEKDKLIKDKIIKNDKNVISDDIEEPFEIPENWVWCKIGVIGIYKKGPFGSSLKKSLFVEKSKDTIKVYEQQNAINHNSNLGKYYISKEYFESKMKGFEVLSGDLIVSCAGTIGEIYLMPEKIERGIINQALMKIRLFGGIDKQYFIKYFEYNLKQSASEGNGSAIINIPPFEVLKNYAMPIPPLAEQIRIVEKVDKLFEILDNIDEAQKKYQKDKEILKSKIIEAGIRGKLTKQLKSDGNASDLLDEIRKGKEKLIKEGKIKRDKKETNIYKNPKDNLYYEKYQDGTEKCIQDELPFEIPDNWVWCRQEGVCMLYNGVSSDKEELPYLEAKVIRRQKTPLIINKGVKVNKDEYVILVDGENSGEIMKAPYNGYMGSTFKVLLFYKKEISNYIKINIDLEKLNLKENKTGSAIPHLNKRLFKEKLIPIPPLAEQERIVQIMGKILNIMANNSYKELYER